MDKFKISQVPVSFKGAYFLKGSAEALDEVCWYLQKKKGNAVSGFDFLDIRVGKKSLTQTQKILNNANPFEVNNKENENLIIEHLLDLVSIKNGSMKPFPPLKNNENMDLFLTQLDKDFAERRMINMVEDSLTSIIKSFDINEKARILLDNLSRMRNNLSQGKPILNIKSSVVQNHLAYLDFSSIKSVSAEDAISAIQGGKFDIVSGIF